MNNIKNYTIIVLFSIVCLLLLLRQCEPSKPKETFLKGKETVIHDTVPAPYKVVEFKSKYYPKWDTIKLTDTLWSSDLCNFERTYNDSVSNDSITIHSKIETVGVLKSLTLSYRWKVPTINKTIFRTDTLVQSPRASVYMGLILSGNSVSFNASPFVTLNVKRVSLTAGYGLINKTCQIGMGYKIFNTKR